MKIGITLLAIAFSGWVQPVFASSSLEHLKQFMAQAHSMQASFTQTVYSQHQQVIQQASGNMVFDRPGKFRWTYDKPYPQVLVGDGHKLWIYDEDLSQVTIEPLDEALGNTPAALLAGNNAIETRFNLVDAGKIQGINWLEATPKSHDTSFSRIMIGFEGNELRMMRLQDKLGQTTVIQFAGLKLNGHPSDTLFHFVPPKGVDVVGG
ncbi:MAG: outer membrane lipoprotein chaperone LolA [Pseudomonadota bacterium]|nr:outer membrane lipoprotein chaperone LolA [Pseudomonadota bacterium]